MLKTYILLIANGNTLIKVFNNWEDVKAYKEKTNKDMIGDEVKYEGINFSHAEFVELKSLWKIDWINLKPLNIQFEKEQSLRKEKEFCKKYGSKLSDEYNFLEYNSKED